MQNGISAVKPEEEGKPAGEGNGQTGHESDEESELEDEEEEHDDQVSPHKGGAFAISMMS